MASTTILSDNGASSGSAGLKQTAGNDGVLLLQTTTSGGTATTAVTIDTSQNVGLGVTPSAWALAGSTALQVKNAGFAGYLNRAYLFSNAYFNSGGSSVYIASDYAASYKQENGQHQWLTAPSGTAGNTITFTQAMTLDASGNLGIGTTTINNRLSIGDTGGVAVRLRDNNTGVFSIIESNSAGSLGFSADHGNSGPTASNINFSVDGTERARIDSSGNLLVGTTTSTARITALGASTTSANIALYAGNSGGQDLFYARCDGYINTGSRTNSPYNNTTASAANMYVDSLGGLYRSTSSLKYKTDVQDAVHGLSDVMALRPVTYKGNNDGDVVFGGLIAEEVHEAGLTEFVQYAEDGSPDALAYGNMVSLCIKAIQEQQAIIEQLKARLDAANL